MTRFILLLLCVTAVAKPPTEAEMAELRRNLEGIQAASSELKADLDGANAANDILLTVNARQHEALVAAGTAHGVAIHETKVVQGKVDVLQEDVVRLTTEVARGRKWFWISMGLVVMIAGYILIKLKF